MRHTDHRNKSEQQTQPCPFQDHLFTDNTYTAFLKRERNTQVYHLLPQTENWGTCICHLEGHMPTEQRIPGEQNGWKEGKETLVMVQLQNQIVGAFQLTQILTQVEGGDYVNRKE